LFYLFLSEVYEIGGVFLGIFCVSGNKIGRFFSWGIWFSWIRDIVWAYMCCLWMV